MAHSIIQNDAKIFGYIYRIDILNSPFYYIGKQKGKLDLEYSGHGKIIKSYVKKHGISNLKVSVLDSAFSEKELNLLEAKHIGDLWKTDKNCWNLCPGGIGGGYIRTLESNRKISETQKNYRWWNNGIKNIFCPICPEGFVPGCLQSKKALEGHKRGGLKLRGYKHSNEMRQKLSKSLKGRKRTLEERQKQSASMKGMVFSKEHNEKISKSRKGKPHPHKGRPVGLKWWNDGVTNILSENCPEGFVKGLLKRRKSNEIAYSV